MTKNSTPEPTEAAAPELDGVIVRRVFDDKGNILTEVQPIGDVKVTEVQTILELGVKRFRAQAGLA